MEEVSALDLLKTTPIDKLNLGNAALRRAIIHAGFDSLADVLELPEKEVYRRFEFDEADAILSLQDRYLEDPQGLAASVLAKRETAPRQEVASGSKATPGQAAGPRQTGAPSRKSALRPAAPRLKVASAVTPAATAATAGTIDVTTAGAAPRHREYGRASLPSSDPSFAALREYEKRARDVFDDLGDRFDVVMAYQAFDEFATELDDIADAFGRLFRCSRHLGTAFSLIDRYLGDTFIVYVADRARKVYDDGDLWGNFFEGLPIGSANAQSQFKQTFMKQIGRRKMPRYARDEAQNNYFNTALLHGGLSGDSWESLWQSSLLPLARRIADGEYGFGGEVDGRAVLSEIRDPKSEFAPKQSVLSILKKAPAATVAPLLEDALKVAAQVASERRSRGGYTMLSTFGLPDAAMQALRHSQEQKAASLAGTRGSTGGSTGGSAGASGGGSAGGGAGGAGAGAQDEETSRLVYLPMAALHLDLASGTVCMRWPRQQFPSSFADYRIDYYMGGKLAKSQPFQIGVGKCLLEPVEIPVDPQVRYTVELKLMRVAAGEGASEGDGAATEVSSLQQTLTRSKPGCFEFVQDLKGSFRLRERDERISRTRRIAYMVKPGLRIEPGPGMRAVSEYETGGAWERARIFVYDVEPGASGSLVDERTGDELAVWQERYAAKIDKLRIIGETAEGLDLYGCLPSPLGTNAGLPTISIEALDGEAALEDLDISCDCDGTRVALPRQILWRDEREEGSAAKIRIDPRETNRLPLHIETCLVEARQRSANGKVVFRYRFAVVPVRGFRLDSVSFDRGAAVADYSFHPMCAIEVTNSQGETQTLGARDCYSAQTRLDEEFLCVRIASAAFGRVTNAKLALAALDVRMPRQLAEIAAERPVCLADALSLGPAAGNFTVTAGGWRYNRAVLVRLGESPLLFKELRQPGTHEFNVLRDASEFVQADGEAPRDKPLTLTVYYGDDTSSKKHLRLAWTDWDLMRCREGVGFSSWETLVRSDGTRVLRFDGRPLCDLHIDFSRRTGRNAGAVIASASVVAGETDVVLPSVVSRQLYTNKNLKMTVAPTSWFGDPEYEYATEFTLER